LVRCPPEVELPLREPELEFIEPLPIVPDCEFMEPEPDWEPVWLPVVVPVWA
jgi:hypothetical protein